MRANNRTILSAIEVGGFKSAIEPVTVRLRDLTVLAGQNSAGKSTVVQPLLLIKQTMEKPFDVGGLAIDGPLVQFTSTDQFLSHTSGGRTNDFFLTMSSDTGAKACPSASGGSISSGSIGELVIEQTSNISRNARPS